MERVQQLTRLQRVSILKSMPEAVIEEGQLTEAEERAKLREQRQKEREGARKRAENRTPEERKQLTVRKAERDAKKALASRAPKENEKIDPRKLASSYDSLKDLEARLAHSKDKKLKEDIQQKLQSAEAELHIRGIDVGLPKNEIESIAQIPSSYSVSLINNITQAALGISVMEADVTSVQSITTADGVTAIHVPKGRLTIADTVAIAREISSNPTLLAEKGAEVIKFGEDLQDLSVFLASQTSEGKSIFETEEQRQVMADLYNAGVWLERLINGQRSDENITWEDLEKKANDKVFLDSLDENNYAKKKHLVGMLFGKPLGKTGVPTTYQSLHDRFKENILRDPSHDLIFDRDSQALDKAADEKVLEMLSTRGMSIVKRFAPQIAESFSRGKGAQAIARGVQQLEPVVRKVVFEAAKGKSKEIRLPQSVVDRISQRYSDISLDTENLLEAAKRLHSQRHEALSIPREQQLAEFSDMVRVIKFPGETTGQVAEGYQLGKVFNSEASELGCAVRSFLLARIIEEVYGGEMAVAENTLLLPTSDGGVVGHTRLQVTSQNGSTVYTVDPSLFSLLGVKVVDNKELADNIRSVAASGKSVQVEDVSESNAISRYQTLGDSSQESNILVNIAATATGEDQVKLLQMALQDNNQMALLHIIRLSSNTERDQYLSRLQLINPGLEKDMITKMLTARSKDFRIGLALGGGFIDPKLQLIVDSFYHKHGIAPGTPLSSAGLNISTNDIENLENSLIAGVITPADKAILDLLIAPAIPARALGGPFPGGELTQAMLEAVKLETDPDQMWSNFQKQMKVIEDDASQQSQAETQFGPHGRQLQIMTFLIQQAKELSEDSSKTPDERRKYRAYYKTFQAQYNVRTAMHDVFYNGQTGGSDSFPQMKQAANRALTGEVVKIEKELSGAAAVRRLYEQVCNEWYLTHETIGAGDPDKIEVIVRKRFEKEVNAGVVPKIDIVTGRLMRDIAGKIITLATGDPDVDVAERVGKNLFFLKTRFAHFVALGKPEKTHPGLAIGKSPWDFVATALDPYDWQVGRFGLVQEHTRAVLRHMGGREQFNRILAVQDHDSSIWRTPAYIEQFDGHVLARTGPNKQALFMRLYTTLDIRKGGAEAIAEARREIGKHIEDARKDALEEYLHVNPGKRLKAREYANLKAKEVRREEEHQIHVRQSYPTREEILTYIIKYTPEELARVYKGWTNVRGVAEVDLLTASPNYIDFVNAITLAREKCNMEGDGAYSRFDTYFAAFITASADPVAAQGIYTSLQRFFTARIGELADDKAFINGQQNPLYQRVWSQSDAPYEALDIDLTEKKLGSQSIGREMETLQNAYGALNELGAFLAHPSVEGLEKLKGKFLYRSWDLDESVRDMLFEALIKFTQEDPVLRFLMPGFDRMLGRLKGGGSEMQRAYGLNAESDDTVEMVAKIRDAESKGLISHKEADKLYAMANLLYFARVLPLVQIFIAITLVSLLRTALNPKSLLGAA